MTKLLERVGAGETLVADGAMGTLLMEHGLDSGQCPEAFNLEHPEILQRIVGLYLDAGADVVQTNTFGATPIKLAQYGLEDRAEAINSAAVRAARNALGDRPAFVSGSCGPCGKLLMPYGDVPPEAVRDAFSSQISALVDAGVDMLCIETMTDIAEAKLALEAAKVASSDLPVAVTMTFDPTPNGFFTIMGTSVEVAARELTEAGADIIGSNCGNGMQRMVEIAAEMKRHTPRPLMVQANAGLPDLTGGRVVYPDTPGQMAEGCRALLELGVSVIGGCCGTTPEHIVAIRRTVDRMISA